jgi:hypothetical protein
MKSATPLALLRRIALERLPLIVTDDGDFKAISDLVRTGLLEATMQVVLDRWGGGPRTGIVIREITRLGKMSLQHKDLGPVETGTETKGTCPDRSGRPDRDRTSS